MSKIFLAEPWITKKLADSASAQLLTGFVGPGPATSKFASAIAGYAGSPHCLLTTSGTVALSVAAKAIGLSPGDEIVVPSYGVVATINAFATIGLSPRLAEIERDTACISVDTLDQAVTKKTKAVCFVNFSGYTGQNLVDVAQYCRDKKIPLIEDSACALGQWHDGISASCFGDIGIFSFSVPKVLTTGQGGAVLTGSQKYFDSACRYVDHGDLDWRKTNLNRGIGSNLRFNDILSSVGQSQLDAIDELLARKRASYSALKDRLGDKLFSTPGAEAPLQNIVFTTQPDELVASLKDAGIMSVRQYRTISQHPAYSHLAKGAYPAADYWTDHAVFLPFGMALTADDAERIASATIASGITLESPLKQ